MNCQAVTDRLDLLQYGELSFEEEERVRQHLESCPVCADELARVERLHGALRAANAPVPYPALLDCRRNLRLAISDAPAQAPEMRPSWWRIPMPKYAAAAVVALLAFLAGRSLPSQPSFSPSEDAAYRVRSVEAGTAGRVNLVVEETRQATFSGEPGDRHIRNLLLSATRDAVDPGVRVETVDLLRSQANSVEVRGALLFALEHDVNAGVRLRSLEGLRPWATERDVRKALTRVVLRDSNPGVRTQAVDLLTQTREPALVGVLQEALSREDDNYVRLKCRTVLHEMKASEETF